MLTAPGVASVPVLSGRQECEGRLPDSAIVAMCTIGVTIRRDRYDPSPPPRKVQAEPYEFRNRFSRKYAIEFSSRRVRVSF